MLWLDLLWWRFTFIDNTIDYTKSVHLKNHALYSTAFDRFILLVEVVIESGTIVASVAKTLSVAYSFILIRSHIPLGP